MYSFFVDREASVFLQIAQFCNHLVANHSDPSVTEYQPSVVTYLSGDNLHEKQRNQNNFSFTGILDAIPVRHDQIASFYAKFKANNGNNINSTNNSCATAAMATNNNNMNNMTNNGNSGGMTNSFSNKK